MVMQEKHDDSYSMHKLHNSYAVITLHICNYVYRKAQLVCKNYTLQYVCREYALFFSTITLHNLNSGITYSNVYARITQCEGWKGKILFAGNKFFCVCRNYILLCRQNYKMLCMQEFLLLCI